MCITISDSRKIYTIQEDFNKLFPNLKINFFVKPHKYDGPLSKKIISNISKTLGECRIIHSKGSITITPNMIVTDLDQNFNDVYGLSVQVFRRSGDTWLETTVTNSWTLEKQNSQGELLTNDVKQKRQ